MGCRCELFTWQEIHEDWLGKGRLALPAEQVVHGFDVVAERFGREWVEASRVRDGVVLRGTSPTLHIVTLGQWLDSVGEAPNAQHLLDKVRDGLPDARAELAAIHLVCSEAADIGLEIEPPIVVGNRNRVPDFRVRRSRENWTYVEVTQSSISTAQADVRRSLDRLTSLADQCVGHFGLEVFLKRDPSPDEVEAIVAEIMRAHPGVTLEHTELAGDLGTLYWDPEPTSEIIVEDHGQPYTPRLSALRGVLRGHERRQILVRWPFTDLRAEAFLDSEARQLPKDSPGLIMMQTSMAVGAMKAWRGLIEGRFQPSIHTRISAVCLYSSGLWPTPEGEEWRPETNLILNPYARLPLPDWIAQQLARFGPAEADIDAD